MENESHPRAPAPGGTVARAMPKPTRSVAKLVVLGLFVVAVVIAFTQFRDSLTLESLASREDTLRNYQSKAPTAVIGIAFAIYVAVTGLSLPGAAALTLVYAWFFGFPTGLVLVSFASTSGATLAFLFSRFLFRDSLERKFGERLSGFNEALKREGAFYLLTLRLIPAVPFFVINLVMGLTPIKTRTYWWISQLGMLPGTAVYVYAGSQFPSLQELAENGTAGILSPQLLIAFVILGLFPIAVKKLMQRFRSHPGPDVTDQTQASN